MQKQTVLLVLTGHDDELSQTSNFEALQSEALPLARPDLETKQRADVIRVFLRTAVHFIADLTRSEEEAFPEISRYSNLEPIDADLWIDRVLCEADEKGSFGAIEISLAVNDMNVRRRASSYHDQNSLSSP